MFYKLQVAATEDLHNIKIICPLINVKLKF